MTIVGHLVWLRTQRGLSAEKWPADRVPRLDPKQEPQPVAEHALGADEYALSISTLERLYPAPVEPVEEKIKLEYAP